MRQPRLLALMLALLTLLLYLPVSQHGFIVYDDDLYVTENRMVQRGLTWEGINWAFTALHASNWHPLTWLSHMLDWELFGGNAGAHHLINVLFHAANTVLVFWLMWRITASLWAAAIIAALFGWHPLHVESVAWIAERKDVLCAFFGLLALHAYLTFARERNRGAYFAALLLFALGLMSKPMLVTLPCVFLLLDWWPLKRTGNYVAIALEKWPFFLLTALSCVITIIAQRESAMIDLEQQPLGARVANATVAYASYLAKTVWPRDLAIIYPLDRRLQVAQVVLSGTVMIVLSTVVWWFRATRPYLLVGWLWFVGMLIPVIGLVQVGRQAMADRYVPALDWNFHRCRADRNKSRPVTALPQSPSLRDHRHSSVGFARCDAPSIDLLAGQSDALRTCRRGDHRERGGSPQPWRGPRGGRRY